MGEDEEDGEFEGEGEGEGAAGTGELVGEGMGDGPGDARDTTQRASRAAPAVPLLNQSAIGRQGVGDVMYFFPALLAGLMA